jgi:hypothetical protein
MKKRTMPNEPDEMPVPKPTPEIEQPSDPKEPEIPQEDPVREPEELPPNGTDLPEVTSP